MRCGFANNSAVSGCNPACTAALLFGNAACDNECNFRQCGWDYTGQCCPASCDATWADGACQTACNITACGHDGGDCCADATCAAKRGDGTCDAACNSAACGHDGGDCFANGPDGGLAWGGFDLAEHTGFDGRSKGGVGVIIGGSHVSMLNCSFDGNAADFGGAFYVQVTLPLLLLTRAPPPPRNHAHPFLRPAITHIHPHTRIPRAHKILSASQQKTHVSYYHATTLLLPAQGCDQSRARDALCSSAVTAAGETSRLTLDGSTATANTATRGGLMYVAINGQATLRRVDASSSSASEQGGLVWASHATLALDATTVSGVSAAEGGALYLADSTLTADDTTIASCAAATRGGAIFATAAAAATLRRCALTANTAPTGGAVLLLSSATAAYGSGRLDSCRGAVRMSVAGPSSQDPPEAQHAVDQAATSRCPRPVSEGSQQPLISPPQRFLSFAPP